MEVAAAGLAQLMIAMRAVHHRSQSKNSWSQKGPDWTIEAHGFPKQTRLNGSTFRNLAIALLTSAAGSAANRCKPLLLAWSTFSLEGHALDAINIRLETQLLVKPNNLQQ